MIPRVNACFPALSPELWFLLCHAEESEEIYKNPEKHLGQLHPALPQAFRKVYEKAYEDLQELIKLVTRTVSRRTQGLAIIDWKFQTVSEDWGVGVSSTIEWTDGSQCLGRNLLRLCGRLSSHPPRYLSARGWRGKTLSGRRMSKE